MCSDLGSICCLLIGDIRGSGKNSLVRQFAVRYSVLADQSLMVDVS